MGNSAWGPPIAVSSASWDKTDLRIAKEPWRRSQCRLRRRRKIGCLPGLGADYSRSHLKYKSQVKLQHLHATRVTKGGDQPKRLRESRKKAKYWRASQCMLQKWCKIGESWKLQRLERSIHNANQESKKGNISRSKDFVDLFKKSLIKSRNILERENEYIYIYFSIVMWYFIKKIK